VDTGLSIDYDLATPVGLFRFHPLLFFLGSGISSGVPERHLLMHYQMQPEVDPLFNTHKMV